VRGGLHSIMLFSQALWTAHANPTTTQFPANSRVP
jgi:hypothetical protein